VTSDPFDTHESRVSQGASVSEPGQFRGLPKPTPAKMGSCGLGRPTQTRFVPDVPRGIHLVGPHNCGIGQGLTIQCAASSNVLPIAAGTDPLANCSVVFTCIPIVEVQTVPQRLSIRHPASSAGSRFAKASTRAARFESAIHFCLVPQIGSHADLITKGPKTRKLMGYADEVFVFVVSRGRESGC